VALDGYNLRRVEVLEAVTGYRIPGAGTEKEARCQQD
jgi:hypothetical protein